VNNILTFTLQEYSISSVENCSDDGQLRQNFANAAVETSAPKTSCKPAEKL
jgi:hypothetical protein